ncbi:N-acetylglucosamine kinase [Parapedobacter indicus]|uniref:BadF-type ATPase n=1 Tax=Parapedobacter indicus TaxID=1477437 RepID=A0A1I3U7X3_9SPHI|nr:N-acetylglucosamine kinase [Parapedobacter indicus]PPK99209.1 N-acetylglucosamine kinase-like BadF-type ATPase [Parapedobacter indicus]SFJ79678.1 BadF-type ATPase [Parapedobacter indicus]
MILVADSGSSQSDWMLALPDGERLAFTTKGLNPFFVNEKEIAKVIQNAEEITPYADRVTEVYFFGSGCTSPDRREMVSNALSQLFTHAFISVETDLVGAAYATCGSRKGYIATLGTGSDVSFFDGEEVLPTRQGIGYVLGDEGSGVWFGKQLVTKFLYDTMPADLMAAFRAKYRINKEIVIKNVYQRAFPNAYLASFTVFLSDHMDHPYVDELIKAGFKEFMHTNIKLFPDYRDYVCHFVGSVAFYFIEQLREVCEQQGVKIGKVLRRPIEELFHYIIQREKNYEIQL